MEDLNDAYELIRLLANKNQQGFLSPGQFNRAWNHAEMQLFKHRIGLPEQYQPGRPIPPVAYAVTQKIEDDMDPFLMRVSFTRTADKPSWRKPKDFVHPVALAAEYVPPGSKTAQPAEIELLTHAELAGRLSNSIIHPTEEFPVAAFLAGWLEVYPLPTRPVLITYLRYPRMSKWVGTPGTGGRQVYDPAKSVQPEWPRETWTDLIARTLAQLGINLKAQDVQQYAQLAKQQG